MVSPAAPLTLSGTVSYPSPPCSPSTGSVGAIVPVASIKPSSLLPADFFRCHSFIWDAPSTSLHCWLLLIFRCRHKNNFLREKCLFEVPLPTPTELPCPSPYFISFPFLSTKMILFVCLLTDLLSKHTRAQGPYLSAHCRASQLLTQPWPQRHNRENH